MFNLMKNIFNRSNMNKITINGVTTYVSGNNIVVSNNKIMVDGKVVAEDLSGEVTVKFEGDLASLNANTATINGNVAGNVDCNTLNVTGYIGGDIRGNVDANTVNAKNVFGKMEF